MGLFVTISFVSTKNSFTFACMKEQRMNIKIPYDQYVELLRIKNENGIDMQRIISRALYFYFNQLKNVTTDRREGH